MILSQDKPIQQSLLNLNYNIIIIKNQHKELKSLIFKEI